MAWIPFSENEIRVFYTHYISHIHLHQVGGHWCVPCVIHRGDGPNLKIHRATGMWFCHSTCQTGGGILEFEIALNHNSKKDAWEHIFQIIGRSPERSFVKRVVAYYDYVDEEGRILFQKIRYEPKSFSLRQPNPKRRQPNEPPNPKSSDDWLPNIRGVRRVLYRLPQVLQAPIVCVTEGERDVHTVETLGFVGTCNPGGAGKWHTETQRKTGKSPFSEILRGKELVCILRDNDTEGLAHAYDVANSLVRIAVPVKLLTLSMGKDVSDWHAAGGTQEELARLIDETPFYVPPASNEQPDAPQPDIPPEQEYRNPTLQPLTLPELVAAFRKWIHLPDESALITTLAAVAANLPEGDPVWLMLVGPPSSGKTEILDSLMGLPHMYAVGTLTQAALLSGVPKRERTSDSKGGLLRELGHFGFLVAKDFTSVLSMGRDARAPLLAALREIADGHWTRDVGADGGRHLSWSGKAVFLAGVTPIIDQHHAVIAAMGERFILCRVPLVDELEQARFAIQRSEKEKIARSELQTAVRRLFSSLRPTDPLDDLTVERLSALSTLTAKCRSAVERDPYRREIDLIPAAERPARLALALKRVLLGMAAIGVPTDQRWTLLQSLALDCLPQLRRKILTYLVNLPRESWADTSSISIALDYPTTKVRRGLEDLAGHGIVVRSKIGKGQSDTWQISSYCRDLVKTAFPDGAVPDNPEAGKLAQ